MERKRKRVYQRYYHGKNIATFTSTTTEATTMIIQESHPTSSCPSPSLSPSDIVHHDHCYCKPQLQLSRTHLTPITGLQVSLPSSLTDVGTQTRPSPFCIEEITNNDDAVHFYTGFSNFNMLRICYEVLGKSINHLKYWGSNSKDSSVESRGTT